jgi:membrane protein
VVTLIFKRWIRTAWLVLLDSIGIFSRIEGEHRAASFAYYALFSLIPLFTLLLTIGSVFFEPKTVIETAERLFPMGDAQQTIIWKMSDSLQKARGGISVLSLLVLLWSALRFFQVLVQGVNLAWHREYLPWWKLPLKNLLMMAVVASAMGIGLVVPVVLQAAVKLLSAFQEFLVDVLPGMHLDFLALALGGGRYLLAGGLMFYALTALYMLAPGRRIYLRQVWPSALGAAIALQAMQSIFGNYVAKIVNYNVIYGPFGALMLALMWVYVAGVIILFGGCFCAAVAGRSDLENPTPASSSH